jgi:hypothetical protein
VLLEAFARISREVSDMPTIATKPRLVNGAEAKEICGLSYHMLLKRVALGEVRTHAAPGSSIKFFAEDVEKLAMEMGVKKAK